MGWLIGVALGVAAVTAVFWLMLHRPAAPPYGPSHGKPQRNDPGNRLDRKAAHYRASGALPPWD